MKRFSPRLFLRAENGMAAIETALILPFLILLYFGMIDLTSLISFNRKITYSAGVVADLVAQNKTSVLKSTINDYYKAVDLVMAPTPTGNYRTNLYGYRKVGGAITKIWQTSNGSGPSCSTVPTASSMAPLMTAGNDIIVAITCMDYTPYVATFLGERVIGGTSFNVEQQIMVRPRSTTTLTCYETTVGGAACT
ncbi:MAG: TadE/TadG family type IV pilus assembly protein [Hyphomicrobiales bacterium]